MIPMTLYFGNPAHLSTSQGQLRIHINSTGEVRKIPLSDVGFVELDSPQLRITSATLQALMKSGIPILLGDERHMPAGMMLPSEGHTLSQLHTREQVAMSKRKKDSLWRMVVRAKIINQAIALELLGIDAAPLRRWEKMVKPADEGNMEGRAAAWYWSKLMNPKSFRRDPDREDANVYFNYMYAVVRAWVARSIVSSGLLPQLGIFHKNQYNPFPLADDLMEPFRPMADLWVKRFLLENPNREVLLDREAKRFLLTLPQQNVSLDKRHPSFVTGIRNSVSSFLNCLLGKAKTIRYPVPCQSILTG